MASREPPSPGSGSDSASARSVEKGKIPAALVDDAQFITARGNAIGKDGQVTSTVESDTSLSGNVFADPEVREYYRNLYEESQYECRHVFDPDATWSPEEERKIIRKLDWHGEYVLNIWILGY
jgi:hypothetical protein